MRNSLNNKAKYIMSRIGNTLEKHKGIMLVAAIITVSVTSLAFADVSAEAKWTEVMNLLIPWIQRLGGVVMLIGGVMFGLGFKSDDAEQKSRGLSTVVAGAIVIAVAAASAKFIW